MQKMFAKGYTRNWSEEVFVIKKKCITNDPNSEEIIGTFCEKEFQKTNQKEFRIGKVIKKK